MSDNNQTQGHEKQPQPAAQVFQPIQDHVSLPNRVVEELRAKIIDGTLQPGSRLYNELELAEALGVSRSTLRAALDRLVHEGLIVRRRGVGTFVASLRSVVTNLNINLGVTEFIRRSGATPGTVDLLVHEELAHNRVADRLRLEPGASVVVIERVRTADGRRVIFSLEYLPVWLLQSHTGQSELDELRQFMVIEQSLYTFFRYKLSVDIHHGLAWLRPMLADRWLADKLHIPVKSVMMYLEQVDYDVQGRPLLLSDEYWLANAFTFSVHRVS